MGTYSGVFDGSTRLRDADAHEYELRHEWKPKTER
jgi:hypothetical protein